MATRFAAEGARIVVNDIDVANGERVAAAIRATGADAIFRRADVAKAAEVEALEAMLVQMEQAAAKRDFEAYYPLNLAFHGMIVDGSGNATLARQYRAFVKALNLFRARSLVQGGGLAVSNREHRDMVAAIAARDPTWAQETHWRHVASAKDRLLAVVRAEARNDDHTGRTTGDN